MITVCGVKKKFVGIVVSILFLSSGTEIIVHNDANRGYLTKVTIEQKITKVAPSALPGYPILLRLCLFYISRLIAISTQNRSSESFPDAATVKENMSAKRCNSKISFPQESADRCETEQPTARCGCRRDRNFPRVLEVAWMNRAANVRVGSTTTRPRVRKEY